MNIETEIKKQARGYYLMFFIENILRVSMHNIMIKKEGVNYFREDVFIEYENKDINPTKKINIINNATELKKNEKTTNLFLNNDFPYFWYLDFRILISVVDHFKDNYFREMFTNDRFMKEIIHRLKNIEPIRNAIAHNRYIASVSLSELESLSHLIKQGINNIYLNNFEEIALNPLEKIISNFKISLENIIKIINRGEIISRDTLRNLDSNFSVLYSIKNDENKLNNYNLIIESIKEYNQLSRKPAQGDAISNFRKNSNITELILSLADDFGGN